MSRYVVVAAIAALCVGMVLVYAGVIGQGMIVPGAVVIGIGMLLAAIAGVLEIGRPDSPRETTHDDGTTQNV